MVTQTITKRMDQQDAIDLENAVKIHKDQKIDRALDVYNRLIAKYPDHPRILAMMGVAYGQLNDIAKSIEILKKSHELFPDDLGTISNLAKAHLEDSQYDEAVRYAKMALDKDVTSDTALSNLIDALILSKNMRQASEYADWYLSKTPDMKKAMSIRAALWEHLGEPELALPYVLNFEETEGAMSHFCGLSSYLTAMSPEARYKQHLAWSQKFEGDKNAMPLCAPYDTNNPRIINIAFISSDFRVHSVSYFIRPFLEKMNRGQFRLFCYSYTKQTDHVTKELYDLCDEWREIYTLDRDETIQLARQDKIDILIDLNGHTANNRLNVFAKRAAPIQMTWIGYAATTGLKNMDYRLTDQLCDPKETAPQWNSEQLVYMPNGFSCYRPATFSPKVPRAPAKKPFMFGSFNRSTKFNRYMLRCWAKILHGAPDAQLLIKGNGFEDEYLKERTLKYFIDEHIDIARISFEGHEPHAVEHLKKFRKVHLALDSFPYAGTTTTCESLWMGTPLLTHMGQTHAERVSGAILTRMGLENQLVCYNEEDFIAKAIDYANNPDKLKDISGAKLRKLFEDSPIMDEDNIIHDASKIFMALMAQHANMGNHVASQPQPQPIAEAQPISSPIPTSAAASPAPSTPATASQRFDKIPQQNMMAPMPSSMQDVGEFASVIDSIQPAHSHKPQTQSSPVQSSAPTPNSPPPVIQASPSITPAGEAFKAIPPTIPESYKNNVKTQMQPQMQPLAQPQMQPQQPKAPIEPPPDVPSHHQQPSQAMPPQPSAQEEWKAILPNIPLRRR